MKNKLWLGFIGLLVLIGTFAFTPPQKTSAAEQDVTITLHKLLFENGNVPDEIQNDGQTNPFLSNNYEGINGVTFAVYDISEVFYKLRNAGMTVEQAQQKLATDVSSGEPLKSVVTASANNEAGRADFVLPLKNAAGQYAVYQFVETAHPDNVKESAAPLVVVLPVYNASDQALTQIDLYPKNEQVPYTPPDVVKKISAKSKSFENGADIPYEISTTIPVDVWEYQTFTVSDTADEALTMNGEPTIQIDGKTVATATSTLAVTEHGFTVNFDPQVLNDYLGKTITIRYTMHFAGKSDQNGYPNTVTVTPGTHPQISHEVLAKTGGKTFVKVDTNDTKKTLADAAFVVKNSDGKYLVRSIDGDTWVKSSKPATDKSLYRLTSGDDGTFAINDLAYGKYQLVEVVAPKGYVLSTTAVNFTVDDSSFDTTTALNVVNKKTVPPTPLHGVPITGILKHFSQTGEAVVKSLPYLGIMIIAGTVGIWFYKRKKNSSNTQTGGK